MLYNIIFSDNSQYPGGNLKDTLWQQIPLDKKIRSIFYSLSTGDCIAMSGYESYYHLVEVTEDFYGGNKEKPKRIEYSYLIGKKGNKYHINKISWVTGNVERKIVDEKDDLIAQLRPDGWKKGI